MVVGGSTLVQLWGTLMWPRVIGPDLFQLWFSCVWSDVIDFQIWFSCCAVVCGYVVQRWLRRGSVLVVVVVAVLSVVQVWFSCGWQVVQFDVA